MSNKLSLYIDMDEIICKFLEKLCSIYNSKFHKNIKISDIKTWSLNTYMDGDKAFEIINSPGFFGSLEPIEGAIETIEKLINDKYEVFIISSPSNEFSVYEKYKWIQEYLPFFDIRNLILVGNKGELLSRIDGENSVLFDDCPEYIEKFNGVSVVMDRAYNRELVVGIDCDYRVSEWSEFYEVVERLGR